MLIKRINNILTISHPFKSFQHLFSKTHKKHKDKFKLDYEYFSNVPPSMRDDELDRIVQLKKSYIQLNKDIPFFPIS